GGFDMECFRLIEDAYKLNSTAFTCIDWVAQKVSEAPVTLYKKVSGKEKSWNNFKKWINSTDQRYQRKAARMIGTEVEEITEHEVLTMINKRPNPHMTGSTFMQGLVKNLMIFGNAFSIGIASPTAPGKF